MFIHLGPRKLHSFPATACEQSALFPTAVTGIRNFPDFIDMRITRLHPTIMESVQWQWCSLQWCALPWRHNGRDSVSNHQPHDCLLNRLFRRRSKKTSKLRVAGLCAGTSPGTGEFPAQMASYAENVSICWRHHGSSSIWHNTKYNKGNMKVLMLD